MGVEGAKPLALAREAGYGNGVMHTGVLHPPDLTAPGKTLGCLAMPFSTGGWFEPAVSPGASVQAGALAGWYHDLTRLETEEEALHFQAGGIVISHRLHADCEAGDCLIQVGRPATRSDLQR